MVYSFSQSSDYSIKEHVTKRKGEATVRKIYLILCRRWVFHMTRFTSFIEAFFFFIILLDKKRGNFKQEY